LVRWIRPDLAVITGDLINKREEEKFAIDYVSELSKISPIVITFGNWDHWSGLNLKTFKKNLEALGATVLVNECLNIKRKGHLISLISVDDPYTGNDNLNTAIKGAISCFKILLAHSPQIIGSADNLVNLILAGHTHGGRVILPLLGSIFVPLPKKYQSFLSGLYKVDNTLMYVNRGIGTSILPIRLFCPPELTLITLKSM